MKARKRRAFKVSKRSFYTTVDESDTFLQNIHTPGDKNLEEVEEVEEVEEGRGAIKISSSAMKKLLPSFPNLVFFSLPPYITRATLLSRSAGGGAGGKKVLARFFDASERETKARARLKFALSTPTLFFLLPEDKDSSFDPPG